MFKIAICDDNKYDIKEMLKMLKILWAEGVRYEVTCYYNGPALVKDFEQGARYHVLILDMVMKPLNGIETAQQIRKYDVSMPILIVTSTREYALDGYLVNAWRYLTKPLDESNFLNEIRLLLDYARKADENYFFIDNDKGIVKLKLDDILYFDSDLHVITVHTLNQAYSFRGVLSTVEEEYGKYGFYRVHRSFLVNLKHVQKISKLTLTLVNGQECPIGKSRAAGLHEALMEYILRNR